MERQVVSAGVLTQGARLGRYELLEHIATGGMAELFLARTVGEGGFEKRVVLKRILPQLATNADFVHMFLDEARLAAQLHHPNVAQVFDIGQQGGSFFFVMEYVQGRDLRDVLRAARTAGGVPLAHALAVVAGAAAGLHYAHEKLGADGRSLHIVHRDVSPANVLVTFDGGVKLVDFGVAKARSRHAETRSGTLKGKIAYMSPEQCRGEPVDRRSDVFSLGIVLYELTVGARLFRGDNEFALLQQIATRDVPPPSTRRLDYPRELETIVLKALSRDPERRHATAEELQIDLEEFAVTHRLRSSPIHLRGWMRDLFPEAVPGRATTESGPRPKTVIMEAELPDEVRVSGNVVAPLPPGAHPEGTPVSGPLPLPAPATPTAVPPEVTAELPAWLAAELVLAQHAGPAPVAPITDPGLVAQTPRPARAVTVRPTPAPEPAQHRHPLRRFLRRHLGTLVLVVLAAGAGAAAVFFSARRPSPPAVTAPRTTEAPAPPAPAPEPTPTPMPHELPEFAAAAAAAFDPPDARPRQKRRTRQWDPDSPFLPGQR